MKFVTVGDFSGSASGIWEELPREREVIVTSGGKPIALLTPLGRETPEDTVSAIRRAKAVNAVNRMQKTSALRGNDKMTLEEINTVIAGVRGSSRK